VKFPYNPKQHLEGSEYVLPNKYSNLKIASTQQSPKLTKAAKKSNTTIFVRAKVKTL
jgi:hypothetical protein